MTGCATDNREEKRYTPWPTPKEQPDEQDIKKMFSESLKIEIKFIMKKHIFKFNDVIKNQTEGGAIGNEITGELVSIMIAWWDKQLLNKSQKLNIEVLFYKK